MIAQVTNISQGPLTIRKKDGSAPVTIAAGQSFSLGTEVELADYRPSIDAWVNPPFQVATLTFGSPKAPAPKAPAPKAPEAPAAPAASDAPAHEATTSADAPKEEAKVEAPKKGKKA